MYSNSKIYKIVCNQTGLTYYGSTTQPLYKRKHQHEKAYERFLEGKTGPHYKSFEVLQGKDYEIILVEELQCENKEQLLRQERFHIENNECVNKNIPTRTQKEYRDENKESMKEWRIDNEDVVKAHRDANKEKQREYMREYKKTDKYKLSLEKHRNKINAIIDKLNL